MFSENNLNLTQLPPEIQDKIMLNLNSLKDLESMSKSTPFFSEIAAEYEKVNFVENVKIFVKNISGTFGENN